MMLSHYGGTAGLREENLPESAPARPQQLFHYGKPTMADLAAAYAAGIVKNHPFLAGNKRTGFMLSAGFLNSCSRHHPSACALWIGHCG